MPTGLKTEYQLLHASPRFGIQLGYLGLELPVGKVVPRSKAEGVSAKEALAEAATAES